MPRHKNPVNFDPDDENKSFSTANQTPNQRQSTTLKLNGFRQPTQQSQFHPPLESTQFDPPRWNQVNLDHPHKIQVSLHAHAKNKWFSPRVQKPIQFLPPTQQPI